jgi:hypothetical protein
MKRLKSYWWKILLGLVLFILLAGATYRLAILPRIDRWGATDAEVAAVFPGDELVPAPASFVNHAVTIDAAPEHIFPWLLQMGAGRGGLYSYTGFESLIGCPLVNADTIHEEWQDLKIGDEVRMCPNDPAPPPYIVAQIHPDEALVLGHRENGGWVDLWQFVILPQADGTSRLVLRTRTMMTGGFWDVIHPGVFVMERGMLLGIKQRVEGR